MFYVIRALREFDASPYTRFSSHYGSMGHALAGAVGFAAATRQVAIVVTGDGSLDMMNPLRTAIKHGLRLIVIVLNDSRLGLPYFGARHLGAKQAEATTHRPQWDYTRQGSPLVGGRQVSRPSELASAISSAIAWRGCYVVDVLVDRDVSPPAGARHKSVDALFGPTPSPCPAVGAGGGGASKGELL
jgi:thiamine pyrophosphate-dependent acetolactate synthase large subunit-like protein